MLDTVIFRDYTVQHLLIVVGVIVGLFILWSIIKRIFFSQKEISTHVQIVKCPNCGWKGQVSRYAGKCPQCKHPLGDQLAKADVIRNK